jgi:hypothetical protein
MESYKYWLSKEFICPVKTATFEIANDLPLHTLAWASFGLRDWLTEMNNFWGPSLAFLGAVLSVSLLIFRITGVLISIYKAWRDRRFHEED